MICDIWYMIYDIWDMRWYGNDIWDDMVWYDVWDDIWDDTIWYDMIYEMIWYMIRYMILLYNTVHIKSSVTKWPNISSKNSRECSQHHEGNASIAVLKLCRSVPPAWRSTTDLQCPEVEQLRIKTWGCHKAQLKLGIMLSYSFEHITLHIYIYIHFFSILICWFIYLFVYLFQNLFVCLSYAFIFYVYCMFGSKNVSVMWVMFSELLQKWLLQQITNNGKIGPTAGASHIEKGCIYLWSWQWWES